MSENKTKCFAFLADTSFMTAEGAIGSYKREQGVKSLFVSSEQAWKRRGSDHFSQWVHICTDEVDYKTSKLSIVQTIPYSTEKGRKYIATELTMSVRASLSCITKV